MVLKDDNTEGFTRLDNQNNSEIYHPQPLINSVRQYIYNATMES